MTALCRMVWEGTRYNSKKEGTCEPFGSRPLAEVMERNVVHVRETFIRVNLQCREKMKVGVREGEGCH